MHFTYTKWDGAEFAGQKHLELFQQFVEYVMQWGEEAMKALQRLHADPEHEQLIQSWIDGGLLERIGVTFRLTPRAINNMQRKALMEVFRGLRADGPEGHETQQVGAGGDRSDRTRPYQFGDAPSEIDMGPTIRNALRRLATQEGYDGSGRHFPGDSAGALLPLTLREDDMEVHESEARATCSTAVLLDMSGSMGRWERFVSAKRCAMALYALVRQRFARDTIDILGFATGIELIPEHRLALATPKQVSMFDPRVRVRLPLPEIEKAPQYFTNLHLALMTARRLLLRRPGANKQIFIITDGEPTACVDNGFLHLVYPPDEFTARTTLTEAMMIARQGVRICTFALIDDYNELDWVGFVDQMTKLTRGVAFYCTGDDLSQCVMESYLSSRKRKALLA